MVYKQTAEGASTQIAKTTQSARWPWEAVGPGGFRVALKFVCLQHGTGDAEVKALEVIKEIRHPNLLSVHGAWQRDGFLILAMDLADGTLFDRYREAVGEGHLVLLFRGLDWL